MSRKFAWWPLRLSEYTGRFWKFTGTRAWLEWVRVVENIYGDVMYVREEKK